MESRTDEGRERALSESAYRIADRIHALLGELADAVEEGNKAVEAIEDGGMRADAFETLNGLILTKGAVEHAYDVITLLAAY